MGQIKHYNQSTLTWEIDGSGEASNISLSEPRLLNKDLSPTSVDLGFTKIVNKLNKLELNIAWIYLHGAKGGTGGGGGTGVSATITAYNTNEGSPVEVSLYYTTTSTVDTYLQITSTLQRRYTLQITDSSGKTYTSSPNGLTSGLIQKVTISGITSTTTNLVITAFDSSGNYTNYLYITVRLATLRISEANAPYNYTLDGPSVYGTFNVLNLTGGNVLLAVWNTTDSDPLGNDITPVWTRNISNGFNEPLYVPFSDIMRNINPTLSLGDSFTFKLKIYSTEIEGISTNYLSYSLSVVGGNSVLVILDTTAISSTLDSPTQILYTLPVGFNFIIYYPTSNISVGTYKYQLFGVKDGEEELIKESDWSNVALNTRTYFNYYTTSLEVDLYSYYKVTIIGRAGDLESSKSGYFSVVGSLDTNIFSTYKKGSTIADFNTENSPSGNEISWVQTSASAYPLSVPIAIDTHFAVSPFLGLGARYMNLSGAAYATFDAFKYLMTNTVGVDNTILSPLLLNGFYMLVTYAIDDDSDGVVLSFGNYIDDTLTNGFEINAEVAKLVLNSNSNAVISPQASIALPSFNVKYSDPIAAKKAKVNVVGLNVWPAEINTGSSTPVKVFYFAIYVNGVMSKVVTLNYSTVYATWNRWGNIENILYFGANVNKGNPCNVKIYDFKLYNTYLNDLGIVHNYIHSVELANLDALGFRDPDLDSELRKKNFFSQASTQCLLYDPVTEERIPDEALLLNLISIYKSSDAQYELSYPIVHITEHNSSSSSLEHDLSANFTEVEAPELLSRTSHCYIDIYTELGTVNITNNAPENLPTVAIQGTSSVTYNSKNLEITMGQKDDSDEGNYRYLIINNWLPEREYTLKSDVVDSGHVNNVAIGEIINNGGLFGQKPPMSNDGAISSKIKHTSEGFPCLVFITFRPNESLGHKESRTVLLGIYNFNLGRFAYNNLGLLKLTKFTVNGITYTEESGPKFDSFQPCVLYLDELKYDNNTYSPANTYSIELDRHSLNVFEGFTYRDTSNQNVLAQLFASVRYGDTSSAQLAITEAFNKIAELSIRLPGQESKQIPIGTYNSTEELWNPILDEQGNWIDKYTGLPWLLFEQVLSATSALLSPSEMAKWLHVDTAKRYFIVAIIFGLVDSLFKNMVFRRWETSSALDNKPWFTCFYDMDSCLKDDNKGNEVVEYDAHPNKYDNVSVNGYTTAGDSVITGVEYNYNYGNAQMRYLGTLFNRLWEVIQYLDVINSTASDLELSLTLKTLYWEIREKIGSAEEFMANYYDNHINKTGAILYNIDYRIKYINYDKLWKDGKLVDTLTNSLAGFLYGTRSASVYQWLKKRLYFLDSVYYDEKLEALADSIYSQLWTSSLQTTSNIVQIGLTAPSKVKLRYSAAIANVDDVTRQILWVDENPDKNYLVRAATNLSTWTLIGTNYITSFKNFKRLGWREFTDNPNFYLVEDLDMSDILMIKFGSNTLDQLVKLKTFKASNLKFTENLQLLNLESNTRIEWVDISNSDFNGLALSTSGTLKYLNVSGTSITALPNSINGQNSLSELYFDDCPLREVTLSLLPSLHTISNIPASVVKVDIENCALDLLSITYSTTNRPSNLTEVTLIGCHELTYLNLSGQNSLNTVNVLDCPKLEYIILDNCILSGNNASLNIKIDNSLLNLLGFTKLKSLSMYNTNFGWTSLDLSDSKDLSNLNLQYCSGITAIKCASDTYIELQTGNLLGCSALLTLQGKFLIQGNSVFENDAVLDFDSGFANHTLEIAFKEEGVYKGAYDLSNLFKGCKKLGYTDSGTNFIKNTLSNLPDTVTTISSMFEGTISNFIINPDIKLFVGKGILDASKVFKDTQITGTMYAGIFAECPVVNVSEAFANTLVDSIDNNFFGGNDSDDSEIALAAQRLTSVDYLFSGCGKLKAYTVATSPTLENEAPLRSGSFFKNLVNCKHPQTINVIVNNTQVPTPNPDWCYPIGVFQGTAIKMIVDVNTLGEPLLFLVTNMPSTYTPVILTNALYAGVDLKFEDTSKVDFALLFKGTNKPKFSEINSPFYDSNGLLLSLESIAGSDFWTACNIYNYPFLNMLVIDNTIPKDLFESAKDVTTLKGLFANVGLTGKFDFSSNLELFEPCTSLKNISYLFNGCRELKIKLAGNIFSECPLEDVSYAFANSYVYGGIPAGLFYNLAKAISNMQGVFNACYAIHYQDDYTYETWNDNSKDFWMEHLVKTGTLLDKAERQLPEDFFSYCSVNPSIGNVLSALFWKEKVAITLDNDETQIIGAANSDNWIGLSGGIPENIFLGDNIKQSTELTDVFNGTKFMPDMLELDINKYKGTYRDNLYPTNLFKGLYNLVNISGMFANTIIWPWCTIGNPFAVLTDLSKDPKAGALINIENIARLWANCLFYVTYDGSEAKAETESCQYDASMFDSFKLLTNISGVFAGQLLESSGLKIVKELLFAGSAAKVGSRVNIAETFAYTLPIRECTFPELQGIINGSVATNVTGASTYLVGVPKSSVLNSDYFISNLMSPVTWVNE